MLFPTGSIPTGPPIESKKALLLIDFQNEFVDPDIGKLPVPNVASFITKLPSLIAKFRSKGTVVFIRTQFQEPRSAVSPELACQNIFLREALSRTSRSSDAESKRHRRGRSSGTLKPADPEAFLQAGPEARRICLPNTPGVDHCSMIRPSVDPPRDMDVVKSHYSAFKDTPLLTQLRTRMIQHLYVAGSLSNISVYATILDAVRHGMEVTLIEDCLGYRDAHCHEVALRQMVDVMGAMGTDHQELMDELAGLLGDVIREEDFSSRFQVSIGPPVARRTPEPAREPISPEQRKQRVQEWITDTGPSRSSSSLQPTTTDGSISQTSVDSLSAGDSPQTPGPSTLHPSRATPELSPPSKRSNEEFEDSTDAGPQPKTAARPSIRRAPSDARPENSRYKVNRARVRATRPSRESSNRPVTPSSFAALEMAVGPGDVLISDTDTGSRTLASPSAAMLIENDMKGAMPRLKIRQLPRDRSERPVQRKKKLKNSLSLVGPAEKVGEGDSSITAPVVSAGTADTAFYTLKKTVEWQKMFHRSGEVPRLVAVQGDIDEEDESEPIYRHPADESPAMLPFDNTVDMLRAACEKRVGHPLNHALIQYYRSGEDNISEHSDKSLDIVRGSSIVNFSLGAQRVMTIRTKKDTTLTSGNDGEGPERKTQRIPLMHNSIFILGQATNQHWLHSVRADKRPACEKGVEELAYSGERISLTFRQIGTFWNKKSNTIWGQGATAKRKDEANPLLEGKEAESKGELMLRAFGQENHQSIAWDWDEWYGQGFDVINFETKAA